MLRRKPRRRAARRSHRPPYVAVHSLRSQALRAKHLRSVGPLLARRRPLFALPFKIAVVAILASSGFPAWRTALVAGLIALSLSMALLETHLALVANHTNKVMRVLTTVATFILPLSLVTGWFGMNFTGLAGLDSRRPELLVLGLFAAVTVVMGIYLKRRGWL